MDEIYKNRIKKDFDEPDYALVLSELKSITLSHVMADSQSLLEQTWSAVLDLSDGDLDELGRLVDTAKIDFRDVLYWKQMKDRENFS